MEKKYCTLREFILVKMRDKLVITISSISSNSTFMGDNRGSVFHMVLWGHIPRDFNLTVSGHGNFYGKHM